MRKITNAIIYNKERDKILVVDKLKDNWRILTIFPWWKVDEWENLELWLKREIYEELWVNNIRILRVLWSVQGRSPTSNIDSNITLFETEIDNTKKIKVEAEVSNPRYLSFKEILELDTTTNLTKNIINYLISNSPKWH